MLWEAWPKQELVLGWKGRLNDLVILAVLGLAEVPDGKVGAECWRVERLESRSLAS